MTIEEAIIHAEEIIADCENDKEGICKLLEEYPERRDAFENDLKDYNSCAAEHRQLAEWLKALKSAKFEYDEAWRIMNCPTPDVTERDIKRAIAVLDTFRDSLGRLTE